MSTSFTYQIVPWSNKFLGIKTTVRGYGIRFYDSVGKRLITVNDFINLLYGSDEFRNTVISSLQNIPYKAYFYKGSPMSTTNKNDPYYFVVIETKYPDIKSNPTPFVSSFVLPTNKNKSVATFTSNSGNTLIAPMPIGPFERYLHLKQFLTYASPQVKHQFLKTIGEEVYKQVAAGKTVWINTHGHAVYYLHFRIQNNTYLYDFSDMDTVGDSMKLYAGIF